MSLFLPSLPLFLPHLSLSHPLSLSLSLVFSLWGRYILIVTRMMSLSQRKRRGFQERVRPTAKTPKEGKYLGLLIQLADLNMHIVTASGRFIAVFGNCRDLVSQHADRASYVLYLKTCLLPKELLIWSIRTIYCEQANTSKLFSGIQGCCGIIWCSLKWVSPCKLEPPCKCELLLCFLLI